jgi:hypothetical protein
MNGLAGGQEVGHVVGSWAVPVVGIGVASSATERETETLAGIGRGRTGDSHRRIDRAETPQILAASATDHPLARMRDR